MRYFQAAVAYLLIAGSPAANADCTSDLTLAINSILTSGPVRIRRTLERFDATKVVSMKHEDVTVVGKHVKLYWERADAAAPADLDKGSAIFIDGKRWTSDEGLLWSDPAIFAQSPVDVLLAEYAAVGPLIADATCEPSDVVNGNVYGRFVVRRETGQVQKHSIDFKPADHAMRQWQTISVLSNGQTELGTQEFEFNSRLEVRAPK
jgi:hypothetical protein